MKEKKIALKGEASIYACSFQGDYIIIVSLVDITRSCDTRR